MEQNIFSPRMDKNEGDQLTVWLKSLSQILFVFAIGLVPLFFIPGVFTSLGLVKVYFVVVFIFAALIFLALAIFRNGKLSLVFSPTLMVFWLFVVVAMASALLSGDRADALFGNSLEIHTAGFIALLALVMSSTFLLLGSKKMVTRLFSLLGVSTILILLFHLVRLIFGPTWLSFGGMFPASTSTMIGGFNDLAIFVGLLLLVSVVLLQQITFSTLGRVLVGALIALSLILLIAINFNLVWVVVAIFTVPAALYLLIRDTWFRDVSASRTKLSRFTLSMIGLICITSTFFAIGGTYVSESIQRVTQVNYIEIRPSFDSTLDVTGKVLSENALFGTGPNRFEDAWRSYKSPLISQTLFWDTDFSSGSGYVPTLFATTGLAGGIVFIVFLGMFGYVGYRQLLAKEIDGSGWYLVGIISFLSASYLWILAIFYVPGTAALILTAAMTGLTLVSGLSLREQRGFALDATTNKKHGLVLVALLVIVILVLTYLLVGVSKQFMANVNYINTVTAFNEGADFAQVDAGLERSQNLNPQDLYVAERAQLRLSEINRISVLEVTEENQALYNRMISEGIELADAAKQMDSTNPDNHILLTNFYSLLNPDDFEGLNEKSEEAFATAIALDPQNPSFLLLLAQHKARIGKNDEAREALLAAVAIKNNYTDALYLLSQLDIQEGNLESALRFTRSTISLEPQNPTRYFQLGLLLASSEDFEAAAIAFEEAVSLSDSYANARYFLALTYMDLDRKNDALDELRAVLKTNEGNELILDLIKKIENDEYVKTGEFSALPVAEGTGSVADPDGVVTTDQESTSELINSLNITAEPSPEVVDEEADSR